MNVLVMRHADVAKLTREPARSRALDDEASLAELGKRIAEAGHSARASDGARRPRGVPVDSRTRVTTRGVAWG